MSAAHRASSPSTRRTASGVRLALPRVRNQAALVRVLLDEVERLTPPGEAPALEAQLAYELACLGRRCAELAEELRRAVDELQRASRSA